MFFLRNYQQNSLEIKHGIQMTMTYGISPTYITITAADNVLKKNSPVANRYTFDTTKEVIRFFTRMETNVIKICGPSIFLINSDEPSFPD